MHTLSTSNSYYVYFILFNHSNDVPNYYTIKYLPLCIYKV